MKKRILAICDLEERYACNLTDYINEKKSTPFEVQAFTNLESLSQFAKEHPIALLLISTRTMSEKVKELDVERIIILSEGEQMDGFTEEPQVYKYQSSDKLIAEVMNVYAEEMPGLQPVSLGEHAQHMEILGVYSPLARVGKTSFALTMGEILAEKSRVLYLNLEDYSGFEKIFSQSYRADLSDLIYFFRQREGSMIYKLNGVIRTFHNLDYIPPAFSPFDLRDVHWEEWIRFFKEIGASGEYDILILDLGYQVEEVYQILHQCKKIYMPILEDVVSQSKILQFEKTLGALDCQEIQEQICRISLPKEPVGLGEKDGLLKLVNGGFGSWVRRFLEKEELGQAGKERH